LKNKIAHICLFALVNLCRLILAATLLFSGFVKAADPMGMLYKINAYFSHWGMPFEENSLLLKAMVIALATIEFILGINLLFGMRKRVSAALSALFMSLMTAVTVYVYIYNPVPDCGCFGDALILSNGETLAKNIALLVAAIVVTAFPRCIIRLISERNQWITSIYSWIYIIGLGLVSLEYLPIFDFTAFQPATNLRAAWYGKTPAAADLQNLVLFNDKGEDVTEEIVQDTGYTFLLTMPNVNIAEDGCNDMVNDIYDDCCDAGYAFFAVAGEQTDSAAINNWIDRSGAAYPFLTTDPILLKAMVRSNPGLLLLKDGQIINKWSDSNLPSLSKDRNWAQTPTVEGIKTPLVRLLLWFVIPLLLVELLDALWIANKFYKHHHINKKHLKHNKVMRKKIVAGNWKMNLNLQEGIALAKELNTMLEADKPACDVVICTPFIHLASVAAELNADLIGLGAENCADKVSGAYTGEVSAAMVKSTGAQYVILGHSERRAYYHETAEILKEKINLALANGLKVIFCIGEVLEERESGKQNEVVKAQLEGSLFDLSKEEFANIILAYEPVWAIGTGKTATAEQAEEMHAFIRGVIADKFGAEAAENVSILYGGSCKPSNAKEIFAKENVDGGLIGGAALKAGDFKGIIDAWK